MSEVIRQLLKNKTPYGGNDDPCFRCREVREAHVYFCNQCLDLLRVYKLKRCRENYDPFKRCDVINCLCDKKPCPHETLRDFLCGCTSLAEKDTE